MNEASEEDVRQICIQLGNRVRQLREKNGWSQRDMCKRIGVDRSYLSEVENGRKDICLRKLTLIAQAFKLQPWQLLKFKKIKDKTDHWRVTLLK